MRVWFVDEIKRNALVVAGEAANGRRELAPKVGEVSRGESRIPINDVCVSRSFGRSASTWRLGK
jgi:hypothetical protein